MTESTTNRLGVSESTFTKYQAWEAALRRWNRRVNLVGRSTLDDFWTRHALDSLQVWRAAEGPGRWIDLGAGAGFPGIAVAIMQSEAGAGETHLVETSGKKAAFLREAARAAGGRAVVHARRWQDMAPDPFDVITARAFAPLPELLEAAFTFWNADSVGVFPKGRGYEAEIDAARRHWRFDVEPIPSITGDGTILRVRELRRE